MRLFDTLGMGARAIMAQQRGAQVAGNNITNAATPGYHRQEVIFRSVEHLPNGVEIEDVRRVSNEILFQRLRGQEGQSGFAQARNEQIARLESVVGTLGEHSVSVALDEFFSAWRLVSSSPNDLHARVEVLTRSDELASVVQQQALDMTDAQSDVDSEIVLHVGDANQLIDTVGELNRSIQIAEANGQTAAELRDNRDRAISSLAQLTGATTFTDNKGLATVQIEGITVVQAGHVRHLETEADSTTGLHHVYVTDGVRQDLDSRLQTGELGALLQVRDTDIPAQMTKLDQFAYDLATAVNTVHQANVGLDGTTGRDLFEQPTAVSGSALSLAVASAVANTPEAIGAATDPAALPGDNRGATAIIDLEAQKVSNGGQRTLADAAVLIVSEIGETAARASSSFEEHSDRLLSLQTLEQMESGVSVEEQMVLLNQFQRAHQAATRIVSTADEMLQSLLQM